VATFGRYEILDKLGEGAMGVVYRARDQSLGRVVALKMLSAELGDEEELHERFHREAEAIGQLNHPNVVSVFDLGQSEGRLYMAMELLDGDNLRAIIEKGAEISLPERVRILGEICEGVGYAHSKGVVHRDIKPANILVTGSGRVKLLDFGLARVASRETITQRGVILGTPDYMSPEQAMGLSLDHRTTSSPRARSSTNSSRLASRSREIPALRALPDHLGGARRGPDLEAGASGAPGHGRPSDAPQGPRAPLRVDARGRQAHARDPCGPAAVGLALGPARDRACGPQ
jgi:serine/threonine protein kinase